MTPQFLTASDAAVEIGALSRRFALAFDVFARLGAEPDRRDAQRVWLTTLSRRCGESAQLLAELVPESVLLADARAAAEAVPIALPDDPDEALRALIAQLEGLVGRADPIANAPLLRVADALVRDLETLYR